MEPARLPAAATTQDLGFELRPGREAAQLRVVVHVLRRVVVVLGPRAAVGDENRRRVDRTREREQAEHVGLRRKRRNGVLEPRITVHDLRDVLLVVEAALERRHQLELARRLYHPLAYFAITRAVLLDRLRVVILRVPLEDRARVVE